MNIVHEESALSHTLTAASSVSPLHPVVITKFISNAQEIDVDAVAYKGKLLVHAVSEHVENAGVHSGDATLVLPPYTLSERDLDRLKDIASRVAQAFDISGPFNMQVIKKPASKASEDELKVIECNLRASRSFPFVSKVLGHNFIETAAAAITGVNVPEPIDLMKEKRDYTSIKVAQFSWTRLGGADPFLGVGGHPFLLYFSRSIDLSCCTQKWRARVKSLPLVLTSTKRTGPRYSLLPVSSLPARVLVSSSVARPTRPSFHSSPKHSTRSVSSSTSPRPWWNPP